jgi:hypothetical protein
VLAEARPPRTPGCMCSFRAGAGRCSLLTIF